MQPNQLDQDAVNLAKAIRQTESGGNFKAQGKSGEYGGYQFTEPTWNSYAKKHGVNASLKDATPEQQNEVAYKQIKEWKDAGYNVGQIASIWNSGKPDAYNDPSYKGVNKYGVAFDVPAYAKSVATTYQSIKSGGQPGIDANNPSAVEQPKEKTGLIQGIAQSVAQPFLKVLSSGNALLNSRNQEEYNRIQKEGSDFGYLGKATPVGAGFDVTKGVSENTKPLLSAAGTGAEIASYLTPVKGIKAAIGTGALMGGGSKLSETGNLMEAAKGATLGLALGAVGGTLSKVFDVLPKSLTETAFKGLTPEQASKVLADKSIGTIEGLTRQSQNSLSKYGKQVEDILKNTERRGSGNDSIRQTILDFPEYNSDKGVEKMLSKVKSLISSTATAGEERGTILNYIDKIKDGTATLFEKNKVRSAIDKATSGGYAKLAKALTPSAGHDLAISFANKLRNEVQSWVPETQPIFKEFTKEIAIQNAIKKAIKKKGGIIRWSDLIPFLAGSGVAGPLGGAGAVLAERAANNPAVQFGTAKLIQKSGKAITPVASRSGLLSGLSNSSNQ